MRRKKNEGEVQIYLKLSEKTEKWRGDKGEEHRKRDLHELPHYLWLFGS
jgi:hypothetical protein